MASAKDPFGQVLAALKDSDVLGVLSPAASATLAGRGVQVDLKGGGYLCRIGDPGDAVYVILDGEI
jgi:CRP-like cAMP-binding protein